MLWCRHGEAPGTIGKGPRQASHLMIKLKCPKCRAKLKAEDEVMGQEITCPRCHHRFPVALTPDAATALASAQILEARKKQSAKKNNGQGLRRLPDLRDQIPAPSTTKHPSPSRKWIAAHPLTSAGLMGGGIVILLATIIGTYFSNRGKFPPKRRIEQTLIRHGYHKIAPLPSIGILRGRSLWEYRYAIDATQANLSLVKVWTALEDPQQVKAVSSYWFDSSYQPQHTNRHKQGVRAIVGDISGLDTVGNVLYPAQDGYHHGTFHGGGYMLELQGRWNPEAKKPAFVDMSYILQDKTWND